MFKIDKMNSSLLCMVRGKLCMTIATAFTLTMATHLMLFIIFVDKQLLNTMAENTSRDNVKTRHLQKRHVAVADDDMDSWISQDNSALNDLSNSDLNRINTEENTLQRKILEDSAHAFSGDKTNSKKQLGDETAGAKNWFYKTFRGIKSKFFLPQLPFIESQSIKNKEVVRQKSVDVENQKWDSSSDKTIKGDQSKELRNKTPKDKTDDKSNKKPQVPVVNKILDIQEVNILPNKKDHEWDPLDDWNMEHLIVAEQKAPLKKPASNKSPKKNGTNIKKTVQNNGKQDKKAKPHNIPTPKEDSSRSKDDSDYNKKTVILKPIKIEIINPLPSNNHAAQKVKREDKKTEKSSASKRGGSVLKSILQPGSSNVQKSYNGKEEERTNKKSKQVINKNYQDLLSQMRNKKIKKLSNLLHHHHPHITDTTSDLQQQQHSPKLSKQTQKEKNVAETVDLKHSAPFPSKVHQQHTDSKKSQSSSISSNLTKTRVKSATL